MPEFVAVLAACWASPLTWLSNDKRPQHHQLQLGSDSSHPVNSVNSEQSSGYPRFAAQAAKGLACFPTEARSTRTGFHSTEWKHSSTAQGAEQLPMAEPLKLIAVRPQHNPRVGSHLS